MMVGKLLRFGRKQLHTIISREIIKPSSPTPTHLQTYNLSEADQFNRHTYLPFIFFYQNNKNCILTANEKAREMKKSLSQCLTHYYPFAGRLHTPMKPYPYVDCNDEGVVFIESTNDTQLENFRLTCLEDENLVQHFADGLVWDNSPNNTSLLGVQLNHFKCGGMALAISLSHIIADGCTLFSFLTYWACVARYGSTHHTKVLSLNPHIIHSPPAYDIPQETNDFRLEHSTNCVMKKFVFSNSKLSELKNKVAAIDHPTRVEVLTSLLYRTAVAAATKHSGSFNPSYLLIPVNIRTMFVPKLPQTTVGNIVIAMLIPTRNTSETCLSMLVAEIKKRKLQLKVVQSVEEQVEKIKSLMFKVVNENLKNMYLCTILCGFPYNKIDFGWGKPIGTVMEYRSKQINLGFILMDAPDDDGIEALVMLKKEDMEIFENDNEILSICKT